MGKTAGFTVKYYRYYQAATKSVDFEGFKQDLEVNIFQRVNISIINVLIQN